MEFLVIPGRIQMEWLIPVECFQKKGNTFQGIPFLSILPELPEISVPFVLELTYMYQCQAPHSDTSDQVA